ncbi:MAG: hypothetical protein ACYC8T_20355, partial [Myxococcaceae bacterium]
MSTHLVAVGGSGQHVALAYLDLAALAHHVHHVDPVLLYILDKDSTSANGRTPWSLARQQALRLHTVDEGQTSNGWRSSPASAIPPCPEPAGLGARTVRDAVHSDYASLFFTDAQKAVEYTKGYWGQAPVGAAFFDAVLREGQSQLGTATSAILQDANARIVVAGSTVGGTGAGCLPRLVEHLAEKNPNARIMTALFLQWFKLTDENESAGVAAERNAQMQMRQHTGLLYSQAKLARCSTTVLYASPAPVNRPWAGDTQQNVHDDLTVPLYAAAGASDFLHGTNAIGNGIYGIPCPMAEGGGHLAGEVTLFGGRDGTGAPLRLDTLIAQNLELCRRLAWVVRYFEEPPSTKGVLFPGVLGVGALDAIRRERSDAEARDLVRRLSSLLDAKWDALVRIARSDSRVFRGAPPAATWRAQVVGGLADGGIDGLRSWLSAGTSTLKDRSAASLTKLVLQGITSPEAPPARQSSARLLPEQVGGLAQVFYPRSNVGAPDILAEHISSLIDLGKVSPESVPATATLEFMLEQLFDGHIGAIPPIAVGPWNDRWRTLLLGICAGIFKLEPAPEDLGSVKVACPLPQYVIRDANGRIIGATSRRVLLVPAVEARWDSLGKHPALLEGGDAARAVASWFDLLHAVTESGPRPAWLEYQRRTWIQDLRVAAMPDDRHGLVTERMVKVDCGGVERAIPLPTTKRRTDADLHTLLASFSIDVVPTTHLKPHLQTQLDACASYTPFTPEAGPAPHKVVWADLNPDLAKELRFGVVLSTGPGADGRSMVTASALKLPGIADIDVLAGREAVLLAQVDPLGDGKIRLPDFPVQLRYAGLIDRTNWSPPGAATQGLVPYSVKLHGRPSVENVRVQVRASVRATVLVWPRFRTRATPGQAPFRAYFALADSPVTEHRACFVGSSQGAEALDWSAAFLSDVKPRPLYEIDSGNASGGVPEMMALISPSAKEGGGLFAVGLEVPLAPQGKETWGIDFGTSSTVVAAYADGSAAFVLKPDAALDQTVVIAMGDPKSLREGAWFPTWDGKAPRQTVPRPLFPSQLVYIGADTSRPSTAKIGELRYGSDIIIDRPELQKENTRPPERVIGDLKWSDTGGPAQQQRRCDYLIHLLELCFALRQRAHDDKAGLKVGLPSEIQAVFTLPLQMRGPPEAAALALERDVRISCEIVSRLVGSKFQPSFLWESHAGAPEPRPPGQVFAVADLGGGSLDLWGDYDGAEFADSYRFGGHDVLGQWGTISGAEGQELAQKQLDMRRALQNGSDDVRTEIKEERKRAVHAGFFGLAVE